MRIAILTTQCPFVTGGAELHARSLERELRVAGHEAEIVSMPFKWYPSAAILDHMLAARALDVSEFNGVKIDLAICLKFPAYLMRHPNKVYWILHQHRQAYDLWESGHSDLFDDADGQVVREAIRAADAAELGRAGKVFANSSNVAGRLLRHNGLTAEPLYHPPPLAGRLLPGDMGDYFYYPSRISSAKRQEFVIRSLQHADRRVRVVFAGAPDNPEYGSRLRQLAQELGVADQIDWKGFVTDEEMIRLYAGARGVLFTPVDEDLGYVALEAMLARKPVLTLSDAGEPAALVRDGVEGLVTPPDPRAFAAAMQRLAAEPAKAAALGRAGRDRYDSLGVSWERVISRLTGEPRPPRRPRDPPPPPEPCATPAPPAPPCAAPEPAAADGPSLASLAARYEFGGHVAAHRDYYDTHWTRYQATLRILAEAGLRPRRILDLGGSPPYIFSAMLRDAFPGATLSVVQASPAGAQWRERVRSLDPGRPDLSLSASALNVETDPLPFGEGEFDLVLAMEILEHLSVDPSHMFREARRVLRARGSFLVTTPNLVSTQAVWRAVTGASPYSFGLFVPWQGPYGRHNREYTPAEVDGLGRFTGFDTTALTTLDVYQQGAAPPELTSFMSSQGQSVANRGQNIFYLGQKGMAAPASFPPSLFSVDPSTFSADLALRRDGVADEYRLTVTNRSPVAWPSRGPHRVRGVVNRRRQDGRVDLDWAAFPLPRDLQPGDAADIRIRAAPAGADGAWHEIDLMLEGAGPFAGAGRRQPVSLFADDLVLVSGDGA